MMDLKETQEGWGWRFRNGIGTKKFEKQYRIFEPFLPIVQLKLDFWALSCFGDLKDDINQTTQDNNNGNNNRI